MKAEERVSNYFKNGNKYRVALARKSAWVGVQTGRQLRERRTGGLRKHTKNKKWRRSFGRLRRPAYNVLYHQPVFTHIKRSAYDF